MCFLILAQRHRAAGIFFVHLSLIPALHVFPSSHRFSPSYRLPPISPPPNSLCSNFLFSLLNSIHTSEEISLPRGGFKEREYSAERRTNKQINKQRTTFYFLFWIQRKGMGPILFLYCNHFLCWSIRRGISQSPGEVKLLHSLRTHVNKAASR